MADNMPDSGMRVLGEVPAGNDPGGLPPLTVLGKADTAGHSDDERLIAPVSRPEPAERRAT
jgi:hypothetical protein